MVCLPCLSIWIFVSFGFEREGVGALHSDFVVVACGGEQGWICWTPGYCVAATLVGFEFFDQLTCFLVPDEDVSI
jgi:hypothetical protein